MFWPSHHALRGRSCFLVFFLMASNAELPVAPFPRAHIAGKWWRNHKNKHRATILRKKKKKKAICFKHPHTNALWTQSHLSLHVMFSWLQTENLLDFLFFSPAHHGSSRTNPTLLFSSFVTFVIGRLPHNPMRQPWNRKRPFKSNPSHQAPVPSSLRWGSVKSRGWGGGGGLCIMNLSSLIPKEIVTFTSTAEINQCRSSDSHGYNFFKSGFFIGHL